MSSILHYMRASTKDVQLQEIVDDDFLDDFSGADAMELPDDVINARIDSKMMSEVQSNVRVIDPLSLQQKTKVNIASVVSCLFLLTNRRCSDWIKKFVHEWTSTWQFSTIDLQVIDGYFGEIDLFHSVPQPESIPSDLHLRIICDLLQFSIKGSERPKYDARLRVMLSAFANYFEIPQIDLEFLEALFKTYFSSSMNTADASSVQHERRWMKVVLPALAFGAVAGVLGAAAVPLAVGASHLTGATVFGVVGGGVVGKKMSDRTSGLSNADFTYVKGSGMGINIVVDGFLVKDMDTGNWPSAFRSAMSASIIGHMLKEELQGNKGGEVYHFVWETKLLHQVGDELLDQSSTIETRLGPLSTIYSAVDYGLFRTTAEATIVSKVVLAGRWLARTLLGQSRTRPVRLFGYSHACQVIFVCLECLAEAGEIGSGIIEHVVMIGAPVICEPSHWNKVCKPIAGNLFNIFSTKDDYLSKFSGQKCAGLAPINGVDKVINQDATFEVQHHYTYCELLPSILGKVDFDMTNHEVLSDLKGSV